MDKSDCPRQILAGRLRAWAIDERKGIIALFRQLQRMGKAVVHGSHINKSAARIGNGKFFTGRSTEKEQTGILFRRVRRLFLLRVNVIKNLFSQCRLFSQIICYLNRPLGTDIGIPCEDISHIPQGQAVTDRSVGRKD